MFRFARFFLWLAVAPFCVSAQTLVYFGTYTDSGSEGIYCARLDLKTGALSPARLAAPARSPEFLVVHPSGERLYSISDVEDPQGHRTRGVSAFEILGDGTLRLINQQVTTGRGPCFVSLDQTAQVLLLSHYSDGSVISYPLLDDNSIGPQSSRFQHEGSSVNKKRQESAHAHSINVDPSNRHAYAADLGIDQIRIYDLDTETAQLAVNDIPFESTPAGGGVRHMAFHPSGEFAYANLELSSQVMAFRLDSTSGQLTALQTLSSLPAGSHPPRNSTAEIQMHPSGAFLYVANRGHDSISVFAIDPQSGLLAYSGSESTRGQVPRNFGIDPSGSYLVVANQESNDVYAFRLDQESGQLTWTGSRIEVSSPVCVRFAKR